MQVDSSIEKNAKKYRDIATLKCEFVVCLYYTVIITFQSRGGHENVFCQNFVKSELRKTLI